MIKNVTSPPFVHVEFKTRGHNCTTLHIDGKTNLFRILTLEAFRKCTRLYTSDLNLLRFVGLNVKWAVFRKNTDVTQLHPRLKNMTSYDKRAIFDLLFTFFSLQGRATKVPSAHISLTYIHHVYFAYPIDFFALPILKKIPIYQVWFLFGIIPGVDSYSRYFGKLQ